MLIYGKIESVKQILVSHLSNKTLVSINNIPKFGHIHDICEMEEINPNIFKIELQIFNKKCRFEYIEFILSLDLNHKKDEVIVCASFNDLFPNSSNKIELEKIININDFAKNVEHHYLGDNNGNGYIVMKNHTHFDRHGLNVQELASLQHHPDVLGIMWFNK